MLELGCSYGNTASVAAEHGFVVTGVDVSERITYTTRYTQQAAPGSLHFVHDDFYAVDVGGGYDVVCYWNGFGIGSDSDQRRLLRRIAGDWLCADGRALIDVANPFVWAGWAGDVEQLDANPQRGYMYTLMQRQDFDPVENRFVDTWSEKDRPETTTSQTVRCYTVADLRLLLEGTGLRLDAVIVDGQPLDLDRDHVGYAGLLSRACEYLAVLCRE